ncbi:hypothetical protein ACLOJK_003417 [Asimina triloba]
MAIGSRPEIVYRKIYPDHLNDDAVSTTISPTPHRLCKSGHQILAPITTSILPLHLRQSRQIRISLAAPMIRHHDAYQSATSMSRRRRRMLAP